MAACISPIRVKQNDGKYADVPCSRCGFCLSNRRKAWSFRLQREMYENVSARFITLTYDNDNLPIAEGVDTDTGECLYLAVLKKEDVQKFIKRLRYHQGKVTDNKIKYYCVGEYGSRTKRPHYHALIFGVDKRVDFGECWKMGNVDVGDVTLDSIDYVTKYVVNKSEYKNYVVPPFSLISNGIGISHLEKNFERYQGEEVVRGARGYNQKMPRYYKDKLKPENPWLKEIKRQKRLVECDEAIDLEINRLERLGHEEPERYMEERSLVNSNKILRRAKDGQTL